MHCSLASALVCPRRDPPTCPDPPSPKPRDPSTPFSDCWSSEILLSLPLDVGISKKQGSGKGVRHRSPSPAPDRLDQCLAATKGRNLRAAPDHSHQRFVLERPTSESTLSLDFREGDAATRLPLGFPPDHFLRSASRTPSRPPGEGLPLPGDGPCSEKEHRVGSRCSVDLILVLLPCSLP